MTRLPRLLGAPALLTAATLAAATPGHAEERFPTIPPADYTPAQKQAAADFLALDQAQNPVALTASTSVGAAQPGAPAMLRLSADFHVGHATLTWQPTGRPLVTWDFVVEID